jgi:hypothetical protein
MADEPRFAGTWSSPSALDPRLPVTRRPDSEGAYRHAPQPECRCRDCREWRARFEYPEPDRRLTTSRLPPLDRRHQLLLELRRLPKQFR